ncbi:MAG: hypothetical protein ACR2IE_09130 [Candidatus Sumerlaeaceae bacterium]
MKHTKLDHVSTTAMAFVCAMALSTFSGCAAEDSHKGHDHAAGGKEKKGHGHSGEAITHDLGTTEIAGLKLSITQEAVIESGKEASFDIIIVEGSKAPKNIRAWFGIASAEGSVKTKTESEPDRHYHSHVEVPKKIPAGSRYWVEVEPASGAKAKASFEVKTK